MSPPLRARELTAGGRGAICVLELTGEGALEGLARISSGRRLAAGEFGCLALRDACGALLDEAIAWVHSDTRVELHLHGAPALVARVLAELGAAPFESAPASLEERAGALLVSAASEAAARVLLDQAQGALRAELEALLALTGGAFRAAAGELARRGRGARWLLHPPRVVLAGAVNAGKSTLFNVLVGRERVLVHASAGTTRDVVRERVLLGAYAVELFDTAGERALDGAGEDARLERASQALAAELRRSADLVLVLVPPGSEAPRVGGREVRWLRTRADLERPGTARTTWPSLSALRAPLRARAVVEEVVHEALELPREPWVPGAGVPFEARWIERLSEAGGAGDPASARRAVRAWLAGVEAD